MGWRRHGRFFAALLVGVVAAAFIPAEPSFRVILGADLFSATYLALMAQFATTISPDVLRSHSAESDEGVAVILFIALVVVTLSLGAVFLTLNTTSAATMTVTILALAGIPLGWGMLQTVAAFHYARLYYGRAGQGGAAGGLTFEGTKEPGAWEFLYYAFTVGMTAQVSDTVTTSTAMRRVTLAHAVLSFFYNAVILALAVNAALSLGK